LKEITTIRGKIIRKYMSILPQPRLLRVDKTGRRCSRREFSLQISSILRYSLLSVGKPLGPALGLLVARMRASLVGGFQISKRPKVQDLRRTASSTFSPKRFCRHPKLPDWRKKISCVALQDLRNPICHQPSSQVAKPNPVHSIAL
jgi:hypothetical protein